MYFGRCLVTGAHGFLGPYIVAALEQAGNFVIRPRRGHGWLGGPVQAIIHAAPYAPPSQKSGKWPNDIPILLLSSGAAVKKERTYLDGYGDMKAKSEAAIRTYEYGKIARIYSVLGPGVTRHKHFAATQFLEQAIAGGPVVVKDGAIRSYLHPKDVASALLTILAHGDHEPYDVGGEEPITVADLGRRIAAQAGVACHMAEPLPQDVYLPDLTRLHALGWKQTLSTDEAIADTLASLKVTA